MSWLDEILRKHCINIKTTTLDVGLHKQERDPVSVTNSIEEARTAIIEQLISSLPEKLDLEHNPFEREDFKDFALQTRQGYNQAITEVTDILRSLE